MKAIEIGVDVVGVGAVGQAGDPEAVPSTPSPFGQVAAIEAFVHAHLVGPNPGIQAHVEGLLALAIAGGAVHARPIPVLVGNLVADVEAEALLAADGNGVVGLAGNAR